VWGSGVRGNASYISFSFTLTLYKSAVDEQEGSQSTERRIDFCGGDQGGEWVWGIDCTFLYAVV
jgi:hypothetical protein